MLKNGGAVNWYRVQDADGTLGWQARKPDGFIEVPYVGGADPFDREVIADDIYWPEGEKDVDTLNRLGLSGDHVRRHRRRASGGMRCIFCRTQRRCAR